MGNAQPINRTSRLPNPIAFPGYIVAPNGGQVFYVNSNGVQDETTADIASNLFTSLTQAMNAVRANRGDVVICLPGHTENIATTAMTWKAGVRVVGIGNGDERPTFNWNVAGSVWTIAVNNVSIENCILNLASTAAVTVTKAISVSGASSSIERCRVIMGGAGGTQLASIGFEYVTGADKARFVANDVFAPTDAAVVSPFKFTNAISQARFEDNIFDVGISATTAGMILMSTAPTRFYFGYNSCRNSIASSTKAFVAIAAADGLVEYNQFYIQNATGAATAVGTPGALQFIQNFGTAGTTNTTGILTPGTAAT